MYQTPSGPACESGHGDPPLVDARGAPFYDPLPDAPLPGIDLERARTLEARCLELAGQVARLRRALRGVVTHTFPHSDKGTAQWYREALDALAMGDDDSA